MGYVPGRAQVYPRSGRLRPVWPTLPLYLFCARVEGTDTGRGLWGVRCGGAGEEPNGRGVPVPERSEQRRGSSDKTIPPEPAGRGQKGRAAFPLERSTKRRNRR
jgi:hypothetical protein